MTASWLWAILFFNKIRRGSTTRLRVIWVIQTSTLELLLTKIKFCLETTKLDSLKNMYLNLSSGYLYWDSKISKLSKTNIRDINLKGRNLNRGDHSLSKHFVHLKVFFYIIFMGTVILTKKKTKNKKTTTQTTKNMKGELELIGFL